MAAWRSPETRLYRVAIYGMSAIGGQSERRVIAMSALALLHRIRNRSLTSLQRSIPGVRPDGIAVSACRLSRRGAVWANTRPAAPFRTDMLCSRPTVVSPSTGLPDCVAS
jgi:hypothetical protein